MKTRKSQPPFAFPTLLILLLFLPCIGCTNTTKNIANNPKYKTDYQLNQLYTLKQPVFVEQPSANYLILQKPGQTGAVPPSPEQ